MVKVANSRQQAGALRLLKSGPRPAYQAPRQVAPRRDGTPPPASAGAQRAWALEPLRLVGTALAQCHRHGSIESLHLTLRVDPISSRILAAFAETPCDAVAEVIGAALPDCRLLDPLPALLDELPAHWPAGVRQAAFRALEEAQAELLDRWAAFTHRIWSPEWAATASRVA